MDGCTEKVNCVNMSNCSPTPVVQKNNNFKIVNQLPKNYWRKDRGGRSLIFKRW